MNDRRGYALALAAAGISGVSVYVNSVAVQAVGDSTLYTTLKNGISGLVLLLPLLVLGNARAELRGLRRREWAWLAILALVGGSIPYLLFFRGLQLTTASTGAFLNHAQFLFVAVLAVPLLRERITPLAWLGVALLAAGSVVGAQLGALRLDEGALLVLASTFLFAAGVVLARYLLRTLSLATVVAAKMSAGAAVLLLYAGASGHLAGVGRLGAREWVFVVLTGLILVAFTATTTGALRWAPALAVTSIGMAAPLITTALQVAAGAPVRLQPADVGTLALTAAGALLFLAGGTRRDGIAVPA